MQPPRDISEVRRLLGMVNYLGKFLPNLAQETELIRSLLCEGNEFQWGESQEKAFTKKKNFLRVHLFCAIIIQIRNCESQRMRRFMELAQF